MFQTGFLADDAVVRAGDGQADEAVGFRFGFTGTKVVDVVVAAQVQVAAVVLAAVGRLVTVVDPRRGVPVTFKDGRTASAAYRRRHGQETHQRSDGTP